MLYDDRDLVAEMIAFWTEFTSRLLEKCLRCCVVDEIHLSEDMAYKGFSMISPKMTRELILPSYQRWGEIIRRAGVPIYAMDSDGFIGELIPIWMDAGINVCDPIEVAAGNDIVAFRRQFGRKMAYRGGVDKRAISKGGPVIEAELRRIEPVARDGGFMPVLRPRRPCRRILAGFPALHGTPGENHGVAVIATGTQRVAAGTVCRY